VALNVKYFFIALLLGSIATVVLLKPFKTIEIKRKGYPQLEFISFKSFEITKDGVKSISSGSKAFKYDKKVVIKFPKFTRQTKKGVERVFANNGIVVENSYIKFYDSVELHRDDNLTIKSSKILYDMKTNTYSTKRDRFEAIYGKNIVNGEALKYCQKSGKIFAKKIYAKIYTRIDN